jgi:hypothetical protein
MNEQTLVYETNAASGTPSLRATSEAYGEAELREMEEELRPQYEKLARGRLNMVRLQGREFHVVVQRGGNPRQPALMLTPAAPAPARPALGEGWADGFFADLGRLASGERSGPDMAALRYAVEELRDLAEDAPDELAQVLFASYLQVTEHLCRARDAERAALYSLALRALGKRTPVPAGGASPWEAEYRAGRLPSDGAANGTGHGWLRRWLARLLRLGGSGDVTT